VFLFLVLVFFCAAACRSLLRCAKTEVAVRGLWGGMGFCVSNGSNLAVSPA
jgi:hypothetical protein